MAAQLYVFRLYDSVGRCLYVGRSSRPPIDAARSYRTTRPWGKQIDLGKIVGKKHPNEMSADKILRRWMSDYQPLHPFKVRAPRQPRAGKGAKTLLERAALAQAHHRKLAR